MRLKTILNIDEKTTSELPTLPNSLPHVLIGSGIELARISILFGTLYPDPAFVRAKITAKFDNKKKQ
jgi:hypothetical protein